MRGTTFGWQSLSRLSVAGLVALVLAQVLGAAVRGQAALPEKAAALTFAGSLVAVSISISLGPAGRLREASPFPHALLWSAAMALCAALLVVVNASVPSVQLALPLGLGVGLVTLVLYSLVRFLNASLDDPSLARVGAWLVLAGLASAPLWLAPAAELLATTTGMANVVVALSPLTYLAVLAEYDYLRAQWFYTHSPLPALGFAYPGKLALTAAYLAVGTVLLLSSQLLSKRRRQLRCQDRSSLPCS